MLDAIVLVGLGAALAGFCLGRLTAPRVKTVEVEAPRGILQRLRAHKPAAVAEAVARRPAWNARIAEVQKARDELNSARMRGEYPYISGDGNTGLLAWYRARMAAKNEARSN